MRTLLLALLQAVVFIGAAPSSLLHAQSPPADFMLSVTTGGSAPWAEKARITIDNAGQATYVRYTSSDPTSFLADTTFTVNATDLEQIWKTIQDSSFFLLNPAYIDSTARDGVFARLTVTANGVSHEVKIKGIAQPQVQAVLASVNAAVPADFRLQYTPPENLDFSPTDPCPSLSKSFGHRPTIDPGVQTSRDPKLRGFPGPYFSSISSVAAVDASHPGTVVAYNTSLRYAIAHGWASLRSKGDFFGDDVSITVDDRLVPPSTTISVTLYMEFWGPLATRANINKITQDIANKWSGAKTSGGKNVVVNFVTRARASATSPPNTPGYHEIKLVPENAERSFVDGSFEVNRGTGMGVWEVPGDPGLYAHEAGHLMGLPDRYVDYDKKADGSWVNAQTGQSYGNDDAFASYMATKFPGKTVANIKKNLKKVDLMSIPEDGSENDLMADLDKPLRQSDIDRITTNPGLLVTIPPGSVFANRHGDEQNLIVTHGDQVFAGPGQSRVLNGIYAACIDHFKGIPSQNGVFDVTPPVDEWTGIQSAGYMSKLLQYVDSMDLYCAFNPATQEAIWRISDNTFVPALVDSLLFAAGINIGSQILDFPRLQGGTSTDSASHMLIPGQLYVADIQPAFASGRVGNASSVHVKVSLPPDVPSPAAIAWTATGPDGAPAAITGSDTAATITPARSGVYEVALTFSLNDSLQGQKTLTSDRKGYIIVPDSFTETFEHAGLTDRFPWQSYGDVPWTISSSNPETGSYAAQPGPVVSGQVSTLGIDISLPSDSVIVFSVRTLTESLFDELTFSIDSEQVDFYSGGSDWQIEKQPITAGKHRLTWTFSGGPGSQVWLDNIFFPGNAIITSVAGPSPQVPRVFALDQNYPNPFNPTTTIAYSVGGVRDQGSGISGAGTGGQGPGISNVRLVIYDVLGREVAVLVNERKAPGTYTVRFDGSRLASGMYIYRLTAGSFVQSRKMILVR